MLPNADYKAKETPGEVWEKYPERLISLVEACMRMDPNKRITAESLLEQIKREVEHDSLHEVAETYVPLKHRQPEPGEWIEEQKDIYPLFAT